MTLGVQGDIFELSTTIDQQPCHPESWTTFYGTLISGSISAHLKTHRNGIRDAETEGAGFSSGSVQHDTLVFSTTMECRICHLVIIPIVT